MSKSRDSILEEGRSRMYAWEPMAIKEAEDRLFNKNLPPMRALSSSANDLASIITDESFDAVIIYEDEDKPTHWHSSLVLRNLPFDLPGDEAPPPEAQHRSKEEAEKFGYELLIQLWLLVLIKKKFPTPF